MKVGTFCAEMKTNTVFEISREQLDLHFGLILEALGALLDPWAVIMALLEGVFFRVTFHPALERGGGPPGEAWDELAGTSGGCGSKKRSLFEAFLDSQSGWSKKNRLIS